MSTQHLIDRVRDLDAPRVLIVGDCILDRYTIGAVERISPEGPIPILHVARDEDRLGGALNVAANVTSLGGHASVIGVVGDDEGATTIEGLAREASIDVSQLVRAGRRPTIRKTRMIARQQQLLRIDREDHSPIAEGTAADLDTRIAKALTGPDAPGAVVISDYGKGVCTTDRCQRLIALCRERGIAVCVDPKGADYSKYTGATTITPNRSEAELAVAHRRAIRYPGDAEAVARELQLTHALASVVITLGGDGLTLLERDHSSASGSGSAAFHHWPTEARAVFDVTGAGDTVVGVIATGLAAGWPLTDAVPVANHAAGIVVGRLGTASVTREELVTVLVRASERHRRLTAPSTLDELLAVARSKVVTANELESHVRAYRQAGDDVVFTNGCFDILHAGHLASLAWARRRGDRLVVGLNSDASVQRQNKGPGRPINDEHTRALALALLHDVDHVCIFDDETPQALIERIRPTVLVKGEDWRGKSIAGEHAVDRVEFAPLVPGLSTTTIIDKARMP